MSTKLHDAKLFFRRVSVDRLLVIILIGALVVLGWTQNQASRDQHTFTRCVVDYLVKDRAAQNATTSSSRELADANNAAFRTVPDFFELLSSASRPKKPLTPKESAAAVKELLGFSDNITEKFKTSNDKYKDYRQAIKENPRPPDPTKFCKEK